MKIKSIFIVSFLVISFSFATNGYYACIGNLSRIGMPGYVSKLLSYSIEGTKLNYVSDLYVRGGYSARVTVDKDLSLISNASSVRQAFEEFSQNPNSTNICYRMGKDGNERLELVY